ncbi:hypothetical protein C9374_007430 [Naegleria lovaniensis]|uniref:GLTSCR protein conserved domain-containing protein n=1 Tax=Naegleria lovaniensis TaxID=51637 RepID=A0AA88GLE8_NAELO|nr:uncharacterized protein C9374_007430 [Naegleria lovaniensis]KAG2379291.1 hypothetical protein C9374_007430 [Naegleria lovaniensis]
MNPNNLTNLQIHQLLQQQQNNMTNMNNSFLLSGNNGGMMVPNNVSMGGFTPGQVGMTNFANNQNMMSPALPNVGNMNNAGNMVLNRASTPTSTSTTTTTTSVMQNPTQPTNVNMGIQGNGILPLLLMQNPGLVQLLNLLNQNGIQPTPQLLQTILTQPNLNLGMLQASLNPSMMAANNGGMLANAPMNNVNTIQQPQPNVQPAINNVTMQGMNNLTAKTMLPNTVPPHVTIQNQPGSTIHRSTPTSSITGASTPPPNLLLHNGTPVISNIPSSTPNINNQNISSTVTSNIPSSNTMLTNNVNNLIRSTSIKTEQPVTKIEGLPNTQTGNSFVLLNNMIQNNPTTIGKNTTNIGDAASMMINSSSQIKDKRKLALEPDYRTPFRSLEDCTTRLEPFKEVFHYSIKKDPSWEDKIKSVAERFSKSANIADKHVHEISKREIERAYGPEEDIFFLRKIKELEEKLWESEKEEIIRKREEEKKKSSTSTNGVANTVVMSSGDAEDANLDNLFPELNTANANNMVQLNQSQPMNGVAYNTNNQMSDDLDFDKIFSDEDNSGTTLIDSMYTGQNSAQSPYNNGQSFSMTNQGGFDDNEFFN